VKTPILGNIASRFLGSSASAEAPSAGGTSAKTPVNLTGVLIEGRDSAGVTIAQSPLGRMKERDRLASKGLSSKAMGKLLSIRQRAADAKAVQQRFGGDIEQLREDRGRIETQISSLNDRRNDDQPDPRCAGLQTELDAIKREIMRLDALRAESGSTANELQQLSDVLVKYVGRISDGQAVSHKPTVEPNIIDGESLFDAVERRRRRVRELRSDLEQVRSLPYPSSEAKQLMRVQIARLAEKGEPNVFDLIDTRGEIVWPSETLQSMSEPSDGSGRHLILTSVPAFLPLMASIFQAELISFLDKKIDQHSDDSVALTAEQRATKSREILSDILAVEREEEELIEQIESGGATLVRRRDADPRAVLGLSSDLPAPSR
jgi:hypothetical protein